MRIPALAITQRHPKGLFCKTDRLYAEVAEFIYTRLKDEISNLLDDNGLKRASISCALFLEDHFSNTHQMAVFMQWHQQKFGTLLPIYNYVDPTSLFTKQFQLVLWHAICAERDGRIINPENEGLTLISMRILAEMSETGLWDCLVPNEQLADHLYCEETQNDIMEIKGVLMWIQHYSFFGYWYDLPEDESIADGVDTVLSQANDSQRTYAIDSLSAFGRQCWPCSLKPQEIYARMIRFEMEDDNDPMAQDIEDIDYKKFALYRKVHFGSDNILMEDFQGHQFSVARNSFGPMPVQEAQESTHFVGSFVRFHNKYESNGISLWTSLSDEQYQYYCETRQQEEYYMHMEGQHDKFIQKNDGRRIYFFANFKEYLQWLKKEHKIKNTSGVPLDDDERKDSPLMVFFEPNGQSTLINDIKGIKSPHNPYYDPKAAPDEACQLIVNTHNCSPDCLRYLLDNNLLPDAALNHIKGPEAGRALVQQNAEFLARCFRRDIRW